MSQRHGYVTLINRKSRLTSRHEMGTSKMHSRSRVSLHKPPYMDNPLSYRHVIWHTCYKYIQVHNAHFFSDIDVQFSKVQMN